MRGATESAERGGGSGMNSEEGRAAVSVIMPAYNEEKSIEACFYEVFEALEGYGKPFEIILEEDGSTDRTPSMIDRLAKKHGNTKVLHFAKRMGKGFGIRKCLEVARGECIVFIDSDGEYPAEKIPEFIDVINSYDVVVGARSKWVDQKGGNRVLRALLSRTYGLLVRRLLGVDLQDYQSGLKAFRRQVIDAIEPLESSGFEIDSEMLLKAERKGFKITSIAITYSFRGDSKVNIVLDSVKMLLALLDWKLESDTRTPLLNSPAMTSPKPDVRSFRPSQTFDRMQTDHRNEVKK